MGYKNSFVEDYPHITYTDEADTNFDSDSGGGGLEPGSVTTEAIANGAVTAEKIAEGVTNSIYWITLTSNPEIMNWTGGTPYTNGLALDKSLTNIFSAIKNGKNPKIQTMYFTSQFGHLYAVFDLNQITYSETGTDIVGAYFKFIYNEKTPDDEVVCLNYGIYCDIIDGVESITGIKNIFRFTSMN